LKQKNKELSLSKLRNRFLPWGRHAGGTYVHCTKTYCFACQSVCVHKY